jgi:hypothetical protein
MGIVRDLIIDRHVLTLLKKSLRISVCAMALGGCGSMLMRTPRATNEGDFLVHVVSPSGGEEIDTILYWYTGSEETKKEVQKVNKRVKLDHLRAGQRILIPQALVTQTNPLPRKKFSLSRESAPPPTETPGPSAASKPRSKDPLEAIIESRSDARSASPNTTSLSSEDEEFDDDLNAQPQAVGDAATPTIASGVVSKQPEPEVVTTENIDAEIAREQAEIEKLRKQIPRSQHNSPDVFDEIP